MARIPNQSGDSGPVEVTAEHRDASSAVLSQLCEEVSSPAPASKPLWVEVGHYEQNGFLNPSLYGFWVLSLLDTVPPEPQIPGLQELGSEWVAERVSEWASADEVDAILNGERRSLQSPNSSSEEFPTVWACVLDTSIETQIESTLTSLAMLLARQELVAQTPAEDVETLSSEAARVDEETTNIVGEEIRVNGWRNAARIIQARARASGFSLHVSYRATIMSNETVRSRMPLMRHIYNTLPSARGAIDGIVGMMTQPWRIAGSSPIQALQAARDAMDAIGVSTLTAHCARDAFVCGVGAISLESAPLGNPWVIRPENILEIGKDSAVIRTESGSETVRPALCMKGAEAPQSNYGLSLLEPLIVNSSNRDTFLKTLITSKVFQGVTTHVPQEALDWARTMEPFAARQLELIDNRVSEVFNPAALRLSEPAKTDIYSQGFARMEPAFGSIFVGSRETGE
ncbi:hypothetical protein [Terrabacter carboxydivorans]|uniref:hypothetical protein n=1 Tax=Terrabacter carboxydivorans TaxID=619730 RepID=UPI0031D2272E